uniref:CN hydrolase domain-containing protein n=1 Tax=Meloidogyne hapla TaxID=6305 RepID=A0A1I8BH94_MELHA
MNSTFDWLQKIGEFQNKLEEYQKVVFCEEKLWFFGQKFPSDENNKNNLILAGEAKETETKILYFVSYETYNINIYSLKIKNKEIKLENIPIILPENYFKGFQPTHSILSNKIIYVQGGTLCCGFRWEPNWLLKLSLEGKNSELIKFESTNHPEFNYSGSFANAFLSDKNVWIHFAGTKQFGMSSGTFNGEIWILNLIDTNQPKWEKLENKKLPKTMTGSTAIIYVKQADKLFLIDDQNRILKSINFDFLNKLLIN